MFPPQVFMLPSEPDYRGGSQPETGVIVPARVNKAMEFLDMLIGKQMDRAAGGDSGLQIISGLKLTPEEEATKHVALDMLAQYFQGTLQPDAWETMKQNKMKPKRQRNIGKTLSCPQCEGVPGRKCELCNGYGLIKITPVK